MHLLKVQKIYALFHLNALLFSLLYNDGLNAFSTCVWYVYSLYEHRNVWISVFFLHSMNHLLLQCSQWQCKRIDELHIDRESKSYMSKQKTFQWINIVLF